MSCFAVGVCVSVGVRLSIRMCHVKSYLRNAVDSNTVNSYSNEQTCYVRLQRMQRRVYRAQWLRGPIHRNLVIRVGLHMDHLHKKQSVAPPCVDAVAPIIDTVFSRRDRLK